MYKIIKESRNVDLIDFYNQNNFHVVLSNYGASIFEIQVPNENNLLESITLTPKAQYYFRNSKYFGLTVGRVAGRLDNAEFDVFDKHYKSQPNEGINMLHGGINNLSYRFYDYIIEDYESYTKIVFKTIVKDLEDGFPGNLELRVIYNLAKLTDDLSIEFQAISSKDTLLNLTNHSYFNLSGDLKRTIEDEILTINKSKYSIFRNDLKLLGLEKVIPEFDFRKGKMIGKDINSDIVQKYTNGYDHYFCGDNETIIKLHDKITKRSLIISSDYNDVVIYTNNGVTDTIYLNNIKDQKYLGIAIEPSRFSKILSKDGLVLKANELYNYHINYSYRVEE